MDQIQAFVIMGYRIEEYNGLKMSGHNCNFTYKNEICTKEIVYLKSVDDQIFMLELDNTESECYSGWTIAYYGTHVLVEGGNIEDITHVPIEIDPIVTLNPNHEVVFNCEYFSWDEYGGDTYYPTGYAKVHSEKFTPIVETK